MLIHCIFPRKVADKDSDVRSGSLADDYAWILLLQDLWLFAKHQLHQRFIKHTPTQKTLCIPEKPVYIELF